MTHDENRISDLIDGGSHEKSAIDIAKYELHMRRKAAIEEAADTHVTGYDHRCAYARHQGFIAGMQEVIEHPEKYGLFTREQVLEIIRKGFSNE